MVGISIHALREEGDVGGGIGDFLFHISIHALREEGDFLQGFNLPIPFKFYPRPPRGGRLTDMIGGGWLNLFLSTPSARRATQAL